MKRIRVTEDALIEAIIRTRSTWSGVYTSSLGEVYVEEWVLDTLNEIYQGEEKMAPLDTPLSAPEWPVLKRDDIIFRRMAEGYYEEISDKERDPSPPERKSGLAGVISRWWKGQ